MVGKLIARAALAALCLSLAAGSMAQGVLDWENHPAQLLGRLENGELQGVEHFNLLGLNTDVDALEDIWLQGGDLNFPSGAEQLYVSSDSGSDTMDLYIEGLDADGAEITETVTLAGLTFTATANEYWRVHRVTAMGSTLPVGNIYVHIDSVDTGADGIPDTPQTDTRARLIPNLARSEQGFFTCPASKACFVLNPNSVGALSFSQSAGTLLHRTGATAPWVAVWNGTNGTSVSGGTSFALKFGELEEVKFSGVPASANSVFSAYALVLIYEAD